MAIFHFNILDRHQRVIASNELDEPDTLTACQSVAMALAIFSINSQPSHDMTSIVLLDERKTRIATVSVKVELEPGVQI